MLKLCLVSLKIGIDAFVSVFRPHCVPDPTESVHTRTNTTWRIKACHVWVVLSNLKRTNPGKNNIKRIGNMMNVVVGESHSECILD